MISTLTRIRQGKAAAAREAIAAGFAALLLVLGGGAVAAQPPQATLGNIEGLHAGDYAPMHVGVFTAGPGAPADFDGGINLRGELQRPPEGSFAKYLGDTIAAQLKAAGKLDPNSTLIVSGVIANTHIDNVLTSGRAGLSVKFILVSGGKVRFAKTLSAESIWDAEPSDSVAVPDAMNHYNALFPLIAMKLFADTDFVAATRR